MPLERLKTILEAIPGFEGKVVYRAWNEGHAPPLPFICYLERQSNNFAADGIAYHQSKRIDIELYTDYKDIATEKLVEDALDAAGIYWESYDEYIDDEKMYEKIYEIEV